MSAPQVPSFADARRFWWRLGWISFGGPTGQIAIMHRELVERRKWIAEDRFLHALNYCLLLPGPEAQQLATYLGWTLHGVRGGVWAGLLFILPATFILWALSVTYVLYGAVPVVAAAFHGLVPAVIAIVFHAMIRLARKTLGTPLRWCIALAAAGLTQLFNESYPLVVLGAGLLGWLTRDRTTPDSAMLKRDPIPLAPQLHIGAICLALWLAPLLVSALVLGGKSTITQEGIFFSKAALVTFGGAYAVLPYVAEHAVNDYHWLHPEQMLHGFGLAESTPGPLIMVLQFVGFMGGWNQPGPLMPLLAATLGSLLTTWVTFAPCFLFILAGAPFAQRLQEVKALQSALGAISAAVVGVMARFALWFAAQALFPHGYAQPDWFLVAVTLVAFVTLLLWHVDVMLLIVVCALLGVAHHLLF